MNATPPAVQRPTLPPHRSRAPDAPTVLGGKLVIDFTRVIAGPLCAQMLADLGARVIKIENPAGGDDTRRYAQANLAGETTTFLWLNRGKESVALDLASEGGRAAAQALIARADVLVQNFTTGVMDRLGLGYDAMSVLNPRLVYCSISAYGRDGAFATRSGFDPVVQAESGIMSLNGFTDGPPVRMGPPMIDISTGMMACNAILGGLIARDQIGRGQHVEVALIDTAMHVTGMFGMSYLATGVAPTRFGHAPNGAAPIGLFEAADGPFYLTCGNDRLYRRLAVEVLERPDLAEDPRFATNKARVEHRDALHQLLGTLFAARPRDAWMVRLLKANVPAGPVRTVAEAYAGAEVLDRGTASEISHPTAGRVPNIAPAFRFSATPTADPVAAPTLGQHTHDVLRDVAGYGEGELTALESAGVFGGSRASGK